MLGAQSCLASSLFPAAPGKSSEWLECRGRVATWLIGRVFGFTYCDLRRRATGMQTSIDVGADRDRVSVRPVGRCRLCSRYLGRQLIIRRRPKNAIDGRGTCHCHMLKSSSRWAGSLDLDIGAGGIRPPAGHMRAREDWASPTCTLCFRERCLGCLVRPTICIISLLHATTAAAAAEENHGYHPLPH